MEIIEQNDYLDTLRYLNGKNINESKELKDYFFSSLITNEENLPIHIKELAQSWTNQIVKGCNGPARDYLAGYIYSEEVSKQLTDAMIEDRTGALYLNEREGKYTLTYLGAMKGIEKLVERYPSIFDTFKNHFLIGLITRYANTIGRINENRERLSKLVNIYIESQLQNKYDIEIEEETPQYIDEEFISELKEASKDILNINKIQILLNNLLIRKSKKYAGKKMSQILEELKNEYINATTQEEKIKIMKKIDELYKRNNCYHDSETIYYYRYK